MGTPFLGEIKVISWNFAPVGWALCNGQFLPINQNQALFSILGTTFGGNGQTTFALPDFRGRVPVHRGAQNQVGQKAGQEFHTVTTAELPQHIHPANATSAASTTTTPANTLMLAKSTPQNLYTNSPNLIAMAPNAISNIGGSQPHENRQPFLVLNFIIALQGIFPSQN